MSEGSNELRSIAPPTDGIRREPQASNEVAGYDRARRRHPVNEHDCTGCLHDAVED